MCSLGESGFSFHCTVCTVYRIAYLTKENLVIYQYWIYLLVSKLKDLYNKWTEKELKDSFNSIEPRKQAVL